MFFFFLPELLNSLSCRILYIISYILLCLDSMNIARVTTAKLAARPFGVHRARYMSNIGFVGLGHMGSKMVGDTYTIFYWSYVPNYSYFLLLYNRSVTCGRMGTLYWFMITVRRQFNLSSGTGSPQR